jgi:cytosine/adenosine deaminase-related metal-dependent hydrolase
VGKRGDLVVLRRDGLHVQPLAGSSIESQIVYAHTTADVTTVVVDGRMVVRDGDLVTGSQAEIRQEAEQQRTALLTRAGL